MRNQAASNGSRNPGPESRLSFRVPGPTKELIEQAACYAGETLTSYVLSRVAQVARDEIREHEQIVLSAEDRAVFLAALDDPPEPNAALRAAVDEYRQRVVPRERP